METIRYPWWGRPNGSTAQSASAKKTIPRRPGVQPEALGERRGGGNDRHDAQSGFDCSKLIHQLLLRKNSGTGVRVNADAGGRSSDSQRFPWNERPARRLRRTIAGIGQAFGQPIDLET